MLKAGELAYSRRLDVGEDRYLGRVLRLVRVQDDPVLASGLLQLGHAATVVQTRKVHVEVE